MSFDFGFKVRVRYTILPIVFLERGSFYDLRVDVDRIVRRGKGRREPGVFREIISH
jgi:hypothetical protein